MEGDGPGERGACPVQRIDRLPKACSIVHGDPVSQGYDTGRDDALHAVTRIVLAGAEEGSVLKRWHATEGYVLLYSDAPQYE